MAFEKAKEYLEGYGLADRIQVLTISMSIPLIAGYAAVYPKVTKQKLNTEENVQGRVDRASPLFWAF